MNNFLFLSLFFYFLRMTHNKKKSNQISCIKTKIKQSPARRFALESNNQPIDRLHDQSIKPFDRPIDRPTKSPARPLCSALVCLPHTMATTTAPGLGLASSPPALNHMYMYNLNPNLNLNMQKIDETTMRMQNEFVSKS